MGWVTDDQQEFSIDITIAPICTEGEKKCEQGIEYTCIEGKWIETGVCPEIPWVWIALGLGGAALIGIALIRRE